MRKNKKALPVRDLAVDTESTRQARAEHEEENRVYPDPTSTADDDPIDAEWFEVPKAGPSARERLRAAKENFETRGQARFAARAEQAAAERERLRKRRNLTNQEKMSLLRSDIEDARNQYMGALKKSNVLVPGFTDEARKDELTELHNDHAEMMMHSCLRPLQRGASVASVATVASTMATMWMMSPGFREQIGEHLPDVKKGINERIDRKAEQKATWAEKRVGRTNKKIAKENEAISRVNKLRVDAGMEPKPLKADAAARDLMADKWRQRYEDIQIREHGRPVPYTDRSAGLTEVALMEDAFEKMREPGADVRGIRTNYRAMVTHLYTQAEADGVDRTEVAKASQQVLGERIMEDPRLSTMVAGMAHGGVRMSDPHEEVMAGSQRRVKVWSGEFEDVHGDQVDMTRYSDPGAQIGVQGAFTLRPPMDLAAHRAQMGQTMAQTMAASAEAGDMKAFNNDLAGYMLGYQAKARDFDGEDLGGVLPERLRSSRTMLASMTTDGITEDDQRLAYSHAYTDALSALGEYYPQFQEQWENTYGEGWRQFMHQAVADPGAAYETLSTWERGPGSHMRDFGPEAGSEQTDAEYEQPTSQSEPEFA